MKDALFTEEETEMLNILVQNFLGQVTKTIFLVLIFLCSSSSLQNQIIPEETLGETATGRTDKKGQ